MHDVAREVARNIQIGLYALTIVLGSVGNSAVIWIIWVRLKPNPTLVWILNLAVADLVFCISRILPLTYLTLDQWQYGIPLCQLNGLLKYTNLFCSIFFLVVISVDRALSIRRPLKAKGRRTVSRARAVSLAVWVLALAMSVPYAVNRSTDLNSHNNTKCTMEKKLKGPVRTCLYFVRFLIGFLLPFLVIACCYALAGWGIRHSRFIRKSKILRILVLLVSAFFLCWTPYHTLLLIKMDDRHSRLVRIGLPVATGLSYINSCVNPILYFCVGLGRKRATRRSISGALRRGLEVDCASPNTRGGDTALQNGALQHQTAKLGEIENEVSQNPQSCC